MVTPDTILGDLAAGCTPAETYTDVEVLKARLELDDEGAVPIMPVVDGPGLATNAPYPRHE